MPGSDSQVVSRTEGPTTATWERHKATIKELYLRQNRPLKEIISIMRATYGLVASVKMYKYRLKAWGIRKNSRSAPARHRNENAGLNIGGSRPRFTPATTRTPSPVVMVSAATYHTEAVLRSLNQFYSNLHHPVAAVAPNWSREERRQTMQHRQRVFMRHMHENEPGSAESFKLTHIIFAEIPKSAKQREHWTIPHGLHVLNRISRIPGAGQVALMTLGLCRQSAHLEMGDSHPFVIAWNQLVEQQDLRAQRHRSHNGMGLLDNSSEPFFDAGTLEVFARCADDHLRAFHGPLDTSYLEAHLRMRKNDCSPSEYAAEVRGLLALGASRDDILAILESVFIEELFKECIYVELRMCYARMLPREQKQQQFAAMKDPSLSPSSFYPSPTPSSCQNYAAGGGHGSDAIPAWQKIHRVAPQMRPAASTAAALLGVNSYDCDSEEDELALTGSDEDKVESFVRLIGRLQIAAQSDDGLGLDELASIKAEGVRLVPVNENPGPDPINDGDSRSRLPTPPVTTPNAGHYS